jgi:hypothetical protein
MEQSGKQPGKSDGHDQFDRFAVCFFGQKETHRIEPVGEGMGYDLAEAVGGVNGVGVGEKQPFSASQSGTLVAGVGFSQPALGQLMKLEEGGLVLAGDIKPAYGRDRDSR